MKELNILSIISLLIATLTLASCGGGGGGSTQQNLIISKSSVNSSLMSSMASSSASNNLSSINSSIVQSSQSSMNLQSSVVSSVNSSNFALNILSPATDIYIPVNSELEVSASFSGISANQIRWNVFPNNGVSITPLNVTTNTASVKFKATQKGNYSIQLTNTANNEYAEIYIDVHPVYLAIDTDTQNRILLRGDGRIVSGIQTVPPEAGMVGIAAGFSYGVAIDSTGAVRQWGSVPAPLPAGLDNVKAISAAYYGAAAIKKNGELVIWGKSNNQFFSVPTSLAGKTFLEAEPIGTTTTFAVLDTDHNLKVFFGSDGSELDLPTNWQSKKFTHICGLDHHLLAVDTAGLMYIWKVFAGRESLPGLETLPENTAPIEKVFCNGDRQAAVILSDGKVLAWGADQNVSYFDSSDIPNFPKIKAVGLYTYGDPTFLTEDGAYIDRNNKLITTYDE